MENVETSVDAQRKRVDLKYDVCFPGSVTAHVDEETIRFVCHTFSIMSLERSRTTVTVDIDFTPSDDVYLIMDCSELVMEFGDEPMGEAYTLDYQNDQPKLDRLHEMNDEGDSESIVTDVERTDSDSIVSDDAGVDVNNPMPSLTNPFSLMNHIKTAVILFPERFRDSLQPFIEPRDGVEQKLEFDVDGVSPSISYGSDKYVLQTIVFIDPENNKVSIKKRRCNSWMIVKRVNESIRPTKKTYNAHHQKTARINISPPFNLNSNKYEISDLDGNPIMRVERGQGDKNVCIERLDTVGTLDEIVNVESAQNAMEEIHQSFW